MTSAAHPFSFAPPIEAVRTATRRLIEAAALGDADAIDTASGERAAAVDLLVRMLRENARLDPAERRALLEATALDAAEAEAALTRLAEGIRQSLDSQQSGSRARRGYAGSTGGPSALDRSG